MSGADHEHYDHYRADMIERLDRGYGHVDRWINARIAALLPPGARVLDVGCGFGSLGAELEQLGIRAVGVDLLPFCLRAGRARTPRAKLVCATAEALPFPAGAFDVAVFKDVWHHLADEAPLEPIFAELERVGVRELVISDPNPNPLLLLGRRAIGHVDPVCGPQDARALLARHGFEVVDERYGVVTGLALSGGYVGPELAPASRRLWRALTRLDGAVSGAVERLGLGRQVCWRYFLRARRR
ncbi:MAG: class I SAM-dependent methyltransferase [Planctomycetota bacterium]